MLTDYLTPNRIRPRVAVESWEEALRAAGGLLVDAGTCAPRHVDAMIDAVRDLGPYMVLAHARPEDGVLDVGMSLVTLDPPVDFGAVDREKHLGMLQELARFLDDSTRCRELVEATSVEEILALIENV